MEQVAVIGAGAMGRHLARMDEYNETGAESAKPNRTLKEMYERGEWGRKTGKGFYTYR